MNLYECDNCGAVQDVRDECWNCRKGTANLPVHVNPSRDIIVTVSGGIA